MHTLRYITLQLNVCARNVEQIQHFFVSRKDTNIGYNISIVRKTNAQKSRLPF